MTGSESHRAPAWWPLTVLFHGPLTTGIRRVAAWWAVLTVVAIGTGIVSVVMQWSGVPVRLGSLTYDVTIYPPLLITILLAIWLGPGWGAIPAFLAALFVARYSGLPWLTSSLFALGGPIVILVLWGSMVVLQVHPDLPESKDLIRFLLAGVVGLTASSLAILAWNHAHHLDAATGQRVWRGWLIGGLLQIGLIIAPILRWLGRPARLWFDLQFHTPPQRVLDDNRGVQLVVAVICMMIAVVLHGVVMAIDGIPVDAVTMSGQPVMPLLTQIGLFLLLLLTAILATTGTFASALASLGARQRSVAVRDGLTGCYNRRAFSELFQREADRSRRLGRGISLIALDIDRFKTINDTHGHEAGDEILRHLTQRIHTASRDEDLVFRWGGEEFLLVLPHTNPENAATVAERIRLAVAATAFALGGAAAIPVTVSAGVVGTDTFPAEPNSLIRRADAACYLAKHRGGNRTEVDHPGSASSLDANAATRNQSPDA